MGLAPKQWRLPTGSPRFFLSRTEADQIAVEIAHEHVHGNPEDLANAQ
jgi:hypothetical protein